jgi:hypothetical protein
MRRQLTFMYFNNEPIGELPLKKSTLLRNDANSASCAPLNEQYQFPE